MSPAHPAENRFPLTFPRPARAAGGLHARDALAGALGDGEQMIIKTVPRRGYTLAVPVDLEGPGLAAPEPAGPAMAGGAPQPRA